MKSPVLEPKEQKMIRPFFKMDSFYICGLLLDLVDMIPEAGVPKGLTLVLDGHTNIQEDHIQQK